MFCEEAQDQIGRDWRNPVEPGFAEFTFDIKLFSEGKSAMRLHAHIRRLPRCLSSEILRHIGFSTALLARFIEFRCMLDHQIGCFSLRVALGNRELDALILANRLAKNRTVACALQDLPK